MDSINKNDIVYAEIMQFNESCLNKSIVDESVALPNRIRSIHADIVPFFATNGEHDPLNAFPWIKSISELSSNSMIFRFIQLANAPSQIFLTCCETVKEWIFDSLNEYFSIIWSSQSFLISIFQRFKVKPKAFSQILVRWHGIEMYSIVEL